MKKKVSLLIFLLSLPISVTANTYKCSAKTYVDKFTNRQYEIHNAPTYVESPIILKVTNNSLKIRYSRVEVDCNDLEGYSFYKNFNKAICESDNRKDRWEFVLKNKLFIRDNITEINIGSSSIRHNSSITYYCE